MQGTSGHASMGDGSDVSRSMRVGSTFRTVTPAAGDIEKWPSWSS